jgi:hypothetical protein
MTGFWSDVWAAMRRAPMPEDVRDRQAMVRWSSARYHRSLLMQVLISLIWLRTIALSTLGVFRGHLWMVSLVVAGIFLMVLTWRAHLRMKAMHQYLVRVAMEDE